MDVLVIETILNVTGYISRSKCPDRTSVIAIFVLLSPEIIEIDGSGLFLKEFELLLLLTSKPDKVFTRDEIYSRVWGEDIIVGDRTIDVHIRKLREKLGNDHITTIKGVGYKFVE
jgi:DNA-binding response OmpR family regulator